MTALITHSAHHYKLDSEDTKGVRPPEAPLSIVLGSRLFVPSVKRKVGGKGRKGERGATEGREKERTVNKGDRREEEGCKEEKIKEGIEKEEINGRKHAERKRILENSEKEGLGNRSNGCE